MKIEHIAIWADNIERLRQFYTEYFGMKSNDMYTNPRKQFRSYFLSFAEDNTRIEIMSMPDRLEPTSRSQMKGLAHFAFSVGSKETVLSLTERLRNDGYTVLSEPRTTGDGYFESAVADPEGNYVEITV